VTKFGTGDYIGDITLHAKIQSDYPSGSQQIDEYYSHLVLGCLVVPVFAHIPRLNSRTDFMLFDSQARMSLPGYCILRGIKLLNVATFAH